LNFKATFRVDGSLEMGLGHLIRCAALAHILKNNFEITFVCKEAPDAVIAEFHQANFRCIEIEKEDEFFELLNPSSLAIIDGYQFDTNYQRQIKDTGSKLIFIDDLHDKEFYADLIINHAPGITPANYHAQPYTRFALGLDFVLLRPAFLERVTIRREIKKCDTLLICFGGSDSKKLTQSTLSIALEFLEFKKIIVITGAAFPYSEDFEGIINIDSRIDYRHALNEMQMIDAMTEAEIAIIPASGILFEALALGGKIISGIYVDNQKFVYANFLLMNLITGAGDFTAHNIREAIKNVLSSPVNNQQLIDGHSPKRLRACVYEVKCNLREANLEDSELLYNWANDSEVRKNAVSKAPLVFGNHLKWLVAKIKSEISRIFILEIDRIPVGQIRYDLQDGEWTVDYSITSELRGQGLGKIILKLSMEYFKNQDVRAFVKEGNVSSKLVFIALGFNQTGEFEINSELYTEFKLKA